MWGNPVYLQQVVNSQRVESNQYILRHEHTIPQFRARTSAFLESFFPQTVLDWNSLSDQVKSSDSADIFMSKLNEDLEKPPKWYYYGSRNLSIKHAKLRMLCSPLNDHLYSHIHVVESPACQCGHARENNKHFLLECILFFNERSDIITKLRAIGFETTLTKL